MTRIGRILQSKEVDGTILLQVRLQIGYHLLLQVDRDVLQGIACYNCDESASMLMPLC